MEIFVPADAVDGMPVPVKASDVTAPGAEITPTDEMTEAARVAIAARLPAFQQLRSYEQFRIAHMALAAGLSVPSARQMNRALPLAVLFLLVGACGRRPTAPVEGVCWMEDVKVPILNAAGDTVAFNTFRTRRCSGS